MGQGIDALRAFLAVCDGPLRGDEFELVAESTIGRNKGLTIVLPAKTRGVSSEHASIRRTAAGIWVLEDRGSKGGTFLDKERVARGTRPVLRSGDVVTFGKGGPSAVFT